MKAGKMNITPEQLHEIALRVSYLTHIQISQGMSNGEKQLIDYTTRLFAEFQKLQDSRVVELARSLLLTEHKFDMQHAANIAIAKEYDQLVAKLTALEEQEPVAWVPLADSQWMSIVNHKCCFADFDKEEAVHLAVRMTEEKLRELNAAPVVPSVLEGKEFSLALSAFNNQKELT